MLNTTFHIEFIGLTDLGLIREKNEDVWGAFAEEDLFLLSDGMGGHKGGEVAAQLAVDSFEEILRKELKIKKSDQNEWIPTFQKAFLETNAKIFQKGKSDPNLSGMGTTLVALCFFQENALIGHVGDSRIYRFRENRLEKMTEDHSLIGELLEIGAIKPEDAKEFPYQHILTRALGTHPKVKPTIRFIDIKLKDIFLLCSDGLTNFVSESEIKSILELNIDLKKMGQALIDLANEHGGGDNITLILLKVSNDLSR